VQVDLSAPWLIAVLLGTVRAAAWLAVVPPFSTAMTGGIPRTALMGVAVGLGVLSAPLLLAQGVPSTTPGLVGAVVLGVFIGAALGFVVRVLVSAVSGAGSLVDLLGGITPLPAYDPISASEIPIMGQLFDQVAIVVLFASNGELLVVQGFETSFQVSRAPIDHFGGTILPQVLVNGLATFFTAALEIAAPVLVVLFSLQIALALLAKAAPQLNAWWLGLPLQVVLALVLSAFALRVIPGALANLVQIMVGDLRALLGLG
jgi:flagellar biosynthetic protein FliR